MTRYSERPRDFAHMGMVKQLPCILRDVEGAGDCSSRLVEADHAGERAYSQKAPDGTTIPMCRRHHQDRTDSTGYFEGFDAAMMREWCDQAIDATNLKTDWLNTIGWF